MASIEQICEVLKAHEEGKTVQYRDVYGDWIGVNPIMCTVTYLQSVELRVKPRPRELWVVDYEDGLYSTFENEAKARSYITDGNYSRLHKFREVTDESE